jgi:TAG lipase / steryl ester hydrolase / phospholipase A2 / LPA acyltransferase
MITAGGRGLRHLEKSMANAESYEEWQEAARKHDQLSGMQRWRRNDWSSSYDYVSIRHRLDRLRTLRARHDYPGLLFTLNEGIHGNVGGMGRSELYQVARFGTKLVIEEYIEEIADSLRLLATIDHKEISEAERLDFFRRAHHCFGRSALMMSGSGMLLYFHVGVIKSLLEQGLLPQILSGSSGGSFVGSLLATHSAVEREALFDSAHLVNEIETEKRRLGILHRIRPQILQVHEIQGIVERLIPDLTFQEALEKTGIHMNISIAPAETHQTSRLLNATTTPNVLIRESIMASAAVPGVYPPVTLMARDKYGYKKEYLPSRKWVDGAVSDDLPAKRLARLYGVNHYIVSQTNPHIIPFIRDSHRRRSALDVIRNASTRTAREWLNASAEIMQKPLSKRPGLYQLTNTLLSVINQDYVGDINIIPPFRFHNPTRLLAHLTEPEILKLIQIGKRSTWPKMEMIRIQTSISRTLTSLCEDLGIQT